MAVLGLYIGSLHRLILRPIIALALARKKACSPTCLDSENFLFLPEEEATDQDQAVHFSFSTQPDRGPRSTSGSEDEPISTPIRPEPSSSARKASYRTTESSIEIVSSLEQAVNKLESRKGKQRASRSHLPDLRDHTLSASMDSGKAQARNARSEIMNKNDPLVSSKLGLTESALPKRAMSKQTEGNSSETPTSSSSHISKRARSSKTSGIDTSIPIKRRRSRRVRNIDALSYDLRYHPIDAFTRPKAFRKMLNTYSKAAHPEHDISHNDELNSGGADNEEIDDDGSDATTTSHAETEGLRRTIEPSNTNGEDCEASRRRSRRQLNLRRPQPLYDTS